MAITVTCPSCEHTFSIRDEYAGKKGKCPSCGSVFRAGSDEPVAAPKPSFRGRTPGAGRGTSQSEAPVGIIDAVETAPSALGSLGLEDPTSPSARIASKGGGGTPGRRRKSSTPPWVWIVIGLFVCASVGGIGLWIGTRPDETVAKNDKKANSQKKGKAKADDGGKSGKNDKQDVTTPAKNELPKADGNFVESPPGVTGTKLEYDFFVDVMPAIVKIFNIQGGEPGGTGTGFVINEQGWIATNHHVIDGADALKVRVQSGTEYEIEGIIADHPKQDLAIIKPKGTLPGVKILKLAHDDEFKVGTPVYAVGNPGKTQFVVTRGIVTRVTNQRALQSENLNLDVPLFIDPVTDVTMIEHDARIYPGNSGGPLLNERMEVVGVNTLLSFTFLYPGDEENEVQVPMFGLASHARYLHELATKSDGKVMSFEEAKRNSQ